MFGKSNGKLLYDEVKPVAVFISFMGATTDIDDDGRITEYVPRGEVVVNAARISAVYDHTIMTDGHKIRVIETLEEIKRKLKAR